MTEQQCPRRVFRVLYIDSRPVVVERTLVSKKGSWFTTRDEGGNEHRENGSHWSDTAMDALSTEAWYLMNRFTVPTCFDQKSQMRHMQQLLEEAFRWGELLGAVQGLRGDA